MGYIKNGIYYAGKPDMDTLSVRQQSTWKQHDHDRQRSDYAQEIVQPFTPDGKPNEQFIDAFPLESREVYHFVPTSEELAKEK